MYKYNPKRITCSAFNIPFEGYMDSTFITIEKVSKSVIVHEGGTGEITAVLNCSQLYKATVTFVQGSPTNTALSAKVPNAKKDYFPTGVFALKDLNGDSVVICKTAFLEDISKQDWGKDLTARPWTFFLPDADIITGGDNRLMADVPNLRAPVSITVGDCTIESRPLPYTRAEDIQPDVYGLLVKVVKRLVDTMGIAGVQKIATAAMDEDASGDTIAAIVVAILPALDTLFDNLRGGELKRLAPLILFSTAVIYPDPETGKIREELALVIGREKVFDTNPSLYWSRCSMPGG